MVERKYGLWKRRFTAMAYGLRLKKENIQKVIVACAVLHNIAIEEREPEPLADERIDRVIRALDVEFDLNQQQQDPVDQRGRRRGIHAYFQSTHSYGRIIIKSQFRLN